MTRRLLPEGAPGAAPQVNFKRTTRWSDSMALRHVRIADP